MNHTITEQIKDNTLYIEVEPQPEWLDRPDLKSPKQYSGKNTWCGVTNNDDECLQERTTPISIGDTVYQGEEWGEGPLFGREDKYTLLPKESDHYRTTVYKKFRHFLLKDKCLKANVGTDVIQNTDWQPPQTMPIELADKTFKVVGIEVDQRLPYPQNLKKVWFWKYSLEEIC